MVQTPLACHVMSGTDLAYLLPHYAVPGTDLMYRLPRYAMPGTDLICYQLNPDDPTQVPSSSRPCYAMPSTDATISYAVPGTDVACCFVPGHGLWSRDLLRVVPRYSRLDLTPGQSTIGRGRNWRNCGNGTEVLMVLGDAQY